MEAKNFGKGNAFLSSFTCGVIVNSSPPLERELSPSATSALNVTAASGGSPRGVHLDEFVSIEKEDARASHPSRSPRALPINKFGPEIRGDGRFAQFTRTRRSWLPFRRTGSGNTGTAQPRTTIMTHVSLVLPLHCASRRTGGVSDDELIHHGFFLAFSFPRRMAWI